MAIITPERGKSEAIFYNGLAGFFNRFRPKDYPVITTNLSSSLFSKTKMRTFYQNLNRLRPAIFRACISFTRHETHLERMKNNLAHEGSIRAFSFTVVHNPVSEFAHSVHLPAC